MAVKYVKDFAFDSGFGFSGSSGKTPVRAYMRGGAVKSNPTKAPSIAPAMVEKRSQGLGGLAKETKKLAAYDKPHVAGKKGAKVAQYAKGGAVKKAHAKKEMPSFLKAKMMKKAQGGPVAEITEGDGMSPLQAMALPEAPMYDAPMGMRGREFEPVDFDPGNRNRDLLRRMQEVPSLPPMDNDGGRNDFLRELLERDTERMRGDAAQQMLEMPSRPGYGPDLGGRRMLSIGELTPVPEEPNYVGPTPRALDMVQVDDMIMTREDAERMRPNVFGPSDGTRRLNQGPAALELPAPIEPDGGFTLKKPGTGFDPYGRASGKRLPAPIEPSAGGSPLAAAARMAPQDRRAMRADRREMARDIMDRYIAGPRRAMPAAGRRGVPVAPRKPMIDRSMPQPYMPSVRATTPEESDAYFKSIGRTPSPEARFAKGGKVSKGEKKIGKVMGEFKRGELHSGSKKGPIVTNPKQATAIALSEARAAGAKIPKKKAMGGKACG